MGAPKTNKNGTSFKPPFPTYLSGYTTFGSTVFHIARLYYRRRDGLDFPLNGLNNIQVKFVSDKLNGISRDLNEPYNAARPIKEQVGTMRTRFPIKHASL